MNIENLISALQHIKTIKVKFPDSPSKGYIYKIPADWEVAIGDELVVRSPNGTKVVQVIEVHDMADIDLEAAFTYKWALSIVPNKEYDERLKKEEKHAKTLKQLQRQAALKKQLAAIVGELGDEAQDFINSITKK